MPLRNKTSRTVAMASVSYILATMPRMPEIILSVNGPEFRKKAFRELLVRYGITHDRSVPYVAHTNWQVARLNQSIKNKL